jgi:hypothetical protein
MQHDKDVARWKAEKAMLTSTMKRLASSYKELLSLERRSSVAAAGINHDHAE